MSDPVEKIHFTSSYFDGPKARIGKDQIKLIKNFIPMHFISFTNDNGEVTRESAAKIQEEIMTNGWYGECTGTADRRVIVTELCKETVSGSIQTTSEAIVKFRIFRKAIADKMIALKARIDAAMTLNGFFYTELRTFNKEKQTFEFKIYKVVDAVVEIKSNGNPSDNMQYDGTFTLIVFEDQHNSPDLGYRWVNSTYFAGVQMFELFVTNRMDNHYCVFGLWVISQIESIHVKYALASFTKPKITSIMEAASPCYILKSTLVWLNEGVAGKDFAFCITCAPVTNSLGYLITEQTILLRLDEQSELCSTPIGRKPVEGCSSFAASVKEQPSDYTLPYYE